MSIAPIDDYLMTNRPGVLVHWDRYGSDVSAYKVLRAERIDGDYSPIVLAQWPADSYIDPTGHPACYYKIQEINSYGDVAYTSPPFVGDELLLKASVYYSIKEFLRVPVYDEQAMFHRGRTSAHVAFKNWNTDPAPEVRITGPSDGGGKDGTLALSTSEVIYTTVDTPTSPDPGYVGNYTNGLKYYVDYRGNIFFVDKNGQPVAIQEYDIVYVTYHVKMFTGSEINDALRLALSGITSQAGASKYANPSDAPAYWDYGLVMGATSILLRNLLIGLNQRERRLLIEDPDKNEIFNNLKDLAKEAQEAYKDQQSSIPKSRYPRIGAVVTPQYQFPGGRARMFRYAFQGGGP